MSSLWIEAILPSTNLKIKMEISLIPKLLVESSVFLTAKETGQNLISFTCTDDLTMRGFLKMIEYCWNRSMDTSESAVLAISSLGIFGQYFLDEVAKMARYFDLPFFLKQIKEVQKMNLF